MVDLRIIIMVTEVVTAETEDTGIEVDTVEDGEVAEGAIGNTEEAIGDTDAAAMVDSKDITLISLIVLFTLPELTLFEKKICYKNFFETDFSLIF